MKSCFQHAPACAAARAAEPADLCPHRRGAGRGRADVLAQHSRRRALAALGRRSRCSSPPASPTVLDGYFARMCGQQSSLGRMLDPIADKLLVSSCLLMLAADETIRGWSLLAAVIILCREILVSGLREYLAELRVSVPVSRLAKWKTTWQLVAVGFLIAGDGRRHGAARCDHADRPGAALAVGAGDALHRLGLFARRPAPYDRRVSHEARLFRLGARADRQGRGRGRRRRPQVATVADLVTWLDGPRRGIRPRLRESEGDPRRDRPEPRQARRGDRRRARDRLLPADDGWLMMPDHGLRLPARADFDAAAEAGGADARPHATSARSSTFTGLCRGARSASRSRR